MPIKPHLRHYYRGEWPRIRAAILARARDRCERCGVWNRTQIERPDGRTFRVVLTVAHLDQDPANNHPSNLEALCQRCHLNHDRPWNQSKAAATRQQYKDQQRPLLRLLGD